MDTTSGPEKTLVGTVVHRNGHQVSTDKDIAACYREYAHQQAEREL